MYRFSVAWEKQHFCDNNHCGHRHIKCYTEGDLMCADFDRDVRLAPELNSHIEDINYMCTV